MLVRSRTRASVCLPIPPIKSPVSEHQATAFRSLPGIDGRPASAIGHDVRYYRPFAVCRDRSRQRIERKCFICSSLRSVDESGEVFFIFFLSFAFCCCNAIGECDILRELDSGFAGSMFVRAGCFWVRAVSAVRGNGWSGRLSEERSERVCWDGKERRFLFATSVFRQTQSSVLRILLGSTLHFSTCGASFGLRAKQI